LNAHHEAVAFTLPAHRPGLKWDLLLDTRTSEGRRLHRPMKGGETYNLEARCLALLLIPRK
jgi:glycogen operon protein